MRPEPGQVLHFSEDPTITRFVPHVAPTARQPEAYVWAVDDARRTRLYAYRLPARLFRPFGAPVPHAVVATEPVEPIGPPEPVGDLFELHEAAGIQLRVLPNLWPLWDAVVDSTLGFSGIRLRNATPRP